MDTENRFTLHQQRVDNELGITMEQLKKQLEAYDDEAFVMEVPLGGEQDGK